MLPVKMSIRAPLLGHWCTLYGLSVGYVDLVNVPHPKHVRLSKRTWRSTGGVYLRSTSPAITYVQLTPDRGGVWPPDDARP